jgi:hypothetical protein
MSLFTIVRRQFFLLIGRIRGRTVISVRAVVALLGLVPVVGFTGCGRDSQSEMADTVTQRCVRRIVSERRGWNVDAYVLGDLPDWPQDRLRIVRADPLERASHAPVFLVAADGTVASQWDADPLSIGVRQAFLPLRVEDALLITRLALMFGKWPAPVGILVSSKLPVNPAKVTGSMRPFAPLMEVSGGVATVRFYTYEPELRDLFDAIVTIEEDGTARVAAEILVEGAP